MGFEVQWARFIEEIDNKIKKGINNNISCDEMDKTIKGGFRGISGLVQLTSDMLEQDDITESYTTTDEVPSESGDESEDEGAIPPPVEP